MYTLRYQVYVENKELTWVQLYTNIQPVNMPHKVGNRLQILCNIFAHLKDARSRGGRWRKREGGNYRRRDLLILKLNLGIR